MSHATPEGGLMKLIVVGDGGTGKTALTIQFTMNHFVEYYDPTIEDIYRRQVEVDGLTYMLELLDTAGQDEYSALRDSYFLTGQGFLIVYDVTNRSTFDAVLDFRDAILRVKDRPSFPMIICGNKTDLPNREVTLREGMDLAKSFGPMVHHIETSAKTNTNVEQAFFETVRMVEEQQSSEQKQRSDSNGSKKRRKRKYNRCRIL